MNWTALYAILKNSINTTKAELEQEITEKIGLTNQFLDELPEVGESGVLYFIPKDDADPSAEDQYFMYVWDPDNTEFVLLDPDMDMSPYAKTADLATVATSGAYSDLSGTPDLTPYITEDEADERYMSGDVLDDETVSGNPMTFESLNGGHAKSCEVAFSPIQSGSGDPSPVNVRPISGRNSLSCVVNNSVNRFDGNFTQNTVFLEDGTTVSNPDHKISTNYMIISGASKVTLSGEKLNLRNSDVATGIIRFAYYDNNKTFISIDEQQGTSPRVSTVPNNAVYVRFQCGGKAESVQLETGESASEYHAYQGTTHTAAFPDTVYGGKVDFVSGKMTSSHGIIDLSTKNWTYNSTYSVFIAYINDKKVGASNIICDSYKLSDVSFSAMPDLSIVGNATATAVYIKNTNYNGDSLTAFKNSLNGVYACYELETPTEITLTPETIELLKGNNTLWTDGDNIELTAAQLELVKVIANPSGQATGTLSKIQINNDILSIPSELPAVTSSDEGKVLMVNDQGEWVADDIPDGTNTQY